MKCASLLFIPESNSALCEIVRRELHGDLIARENADIVFAHAAGNVRSNYVAIFQLDAKSRVGKSLNYNTRHFNVIFFGHSHPELLKTRHYPQTLRRGQPAVHYVGYGATGLDKLPGSAESSRSLSVRPACTV